MIKKNKLISLWLIISIVTGFLAVMFFSLVYLNNNVLCDLDCRGRNEVLIALIFLSLVGMFVGSFTYYFISEKYEKKIGRIHKEMEAVYKFLDKEQKKILKTIIKEKGRTTQAKLVEKTGLSRVKISRSLQKMENKNIVKRIKKGMTNEISLVEDLKNLFLEE